MAQTRVRCVTIVVVIRNVLLVVWFKSNNKKKTKTKTTIIILYSYTKSARLWFTIILTRHRVRGQNNIMDGRRVMRARKTTTTWTMWRACKLVATNVCTRLIVDCVPGAVCRRRVWGAADGVASRPRCSFVWG